MRERGRALSQRHSRLSGYPSNCPFANYPNKSSAESPPRTHGRERCVLAIPSALLRLRSNLPESIPVCTLASQARGAEVWLWDMFEILGCRYTR
jgi:hypothetical protein